MLDNAYISRSCQLGVLIVIEYKSINFNVLILNISNNKNQMHHYKLMVIIAICTTACIEPELSIDDSATTYETPDWTDATHGKIDVPNFEVVFPDNEVLRLDITLSSESWNSMQLDLTANLDPFDNQSDVNFTPLWVPCSFKFNDVEWYSVGIRYKGNSTLKTAFQGDSKKYPFKLDFDEFEEVYSEIKNQRFYGFKQLNLSSNLGDGTFMREKVTADLFREFGVAAAHTAFAAVYLDIGNGSEYIGLYTLVEEIDDTVIDFQFNNGDGNLYKPEGIGASFAQGTFSTIHMNKKSNEDENDFTDVKSLYDILHSSMRISDKDQWKSDLEGIFDVEQFLRYFAVNNTIQNWDSYGIKNHNYFLYNQGNKMTWIPWDHNEALQPGINTGTVSLSASEVGNDWPIIRYIMDIEEYKSKYDEYLRDFSTNTFEDSKMSNVFSKHETLIQHFGIQEAEHFNTNVNFLKWHARKRNEAVNNYLE